jgi:hypothetical protein
MKSLFMFAAFAISGMLSAQVEIDQPIVLTGGSGDRSIQQLEAPVNGTDAVNKDYVDNAVSAGGSSMPTMLSQQSAAVMTFGAAMRYCRDLDEGGFTDWRMPNYNELVYVYSKGENPVNNDSSSSGLWLGTLPGAQYFTITSVIRLSDGYTWGAEGYSTQSVRCVR